LLTMRLSVRQDVAPKKKEIFKGWGRGLQLVRSTAVLGGEKVENWGIVRKGGVDSHRPKKKR